jgi:hypothetical protein
VYAQPVRAVAKRGDGFHGGRGATKRP